MDGAMCRSNAECWKFGSKQQQKVAGKFSTDGKMQNDIKDNIFKKYQEKMVWFCFLYTLFHFTCLVVVT